MVRSILFYCVLFCMCLFTATSSATATSSGSKLPFYTIIHESDINVFAEKVNSNMMLGYKGGDVIIERYGAYNKIAYVMQMYLLHAYR